METALLNPTNTAAQNPVSKQGASSIDSDTSGDFSPVMDEAVTHAKGGSDQQDPATDTAADQPESNDTNPSALPENTLINSAEAFSSLQGALATDTQTIPLQSGEEKSAVLATMASPSPIPQPGTEKELTSTAKVENVLLQQIQQILDQGKNNGPITITGSNSSIADDQNTRDNLRNLSNSLLTEVQNGETQSRQVGVALTTTDNTTIAPQKSAKRDGTRQDVTEQYLNIKPGESKTKNGPGLQQNDGKQKGTEQQNKSEMQVAAGQTPGSSVPDIKPVESGFSQLLGQNVSTTSHPTGIEGKMAPGAHLPVPEREMINNLIQRFTVNPRLQTSKLTMQLHPAELGALKIDIFVKADSIKANIVVQSHQVRETLEKHMPRLRTVLQEQGFTVDSFEISMEGDSEKQKELFQEQFNSQQQEFTLKKSSPQNAESFDALLDSQESLNDTEQDEPGVNVTI
jgi:flagellar hook-length control protein FliK